MKISATKNSIKHTILSLAMTLTTSSIATADDIDIYRHLGGQKKPNILLVLDYSGSMHFDVTGERIDEDDTETPSKISILKESVANILESNKGKVNIGLGSIYKEFASGVRWPISDLNEDASIYDSEIPQNSYTVHDVVKAQIERTPVRGLTATVNALAESAAYFSGEKVLNSDMPLSSAEWHKPDRWIDGSYNSGNHMSAIPASYSPSDAFMYDESDPAANVGNCTNYIGGDQECEGRSTFNCQSIAASNGTVDREICSYYQIGEFVPPKYISPITNSCQSNYIVLISDGEPSVLNETNTLNSILTAAQVPGGNIDGCEDLSDSIFENSSGTKPFGNCAPEILNHLATSDINPDIPESNVITHTIGFALSRKGKSYLELLASSGQGEFYDASSPEELTSALNDIFSSIVQDSQSFAEASVDIDISSLSHDNQTYLSLFAPSDKASWRGNLKGYFLDNDGLVDLNGHSATVVNANGNLSLSDTAHSFWSSVPDGADTLAGGASESITELPSGPNNRNIYTYLGGANTSLALSANTLISKQNTAIDNTILGVADAETRAASLDWLSNAPMGDPLHTKPVIVNYPDMKVVYIMTNQGFLHAFDATKPESLDAGEPDVSGGEELFAYMPKELLSNIPKLYGSTNTSDHIYGLDGAITRWHNDFNGDGLVNGEDTILLVFGMRRGGESYYALDVTNPNRPEFKWQINSTDPGFEHLAQTWSRASLVSVNRSGRTERVLMFGGGYDANTVDNASSATAANGNAIFMVDVNGDLIWSLDDTAHADMTYSIPADLTIIDTDQNGMVDRAYFGDLGGQIWRVDFDDIADRTSVVLTKFADVSNGDYQPLYYPPSVSLNRRNSENFLAISIGSGDRTQPMNAESQNAFFMLRDEDYTVGSPDSSFSTININDLYDATNNNIGSPDEATEISARSDLNSKRGWVMYLNESEKSLSKVVVFQGNILATTFEPSFSFDSSGGIDQCNSGMIGRLYIMDVLDAQPVQINEDGSESISANSAASRYKTLAENMTIPSSPVIVFPPDSPEVKILVGKELVANIDKKIRTVFWHAK